MAVIFTRGLKLYQVTIPHTDEKVPALKLKTEKRSLANAAAQLGKENGLEVKVVAEVVPREVKFKNL